MERGVTTAIQCIAVLWCFIGFSQVAHAGPTLAGRWVKAPAELSSQSADLPTEAFATIESLDRVGGPYWFVAELSIEAAGRYVLDFGSSSTIGHFHHIIIDAEGHVLFDLRGGIQSAEPNPFFMRHGRELEFMSAGTYRLLTEVNSPFLLAEPAPSIAPLVEYQQSTKLGSALVLFCLGILVGLGAYYAALAAARKRAADVLYSLFVLGNVIYNSTALLVSSQLFGVHWFYAVSAPILVSNVVYIFFVMELLDIKVSSNPRLARAGFAISALLCLFCVVSLVQPRLSLEFDRVGVALFISYGLTSGVVRLRQGNATAGPYLIAIASLFVLGGTAISLTGTKHSYFFVEHLGLLAVTAEIVLLALVLARQVAAADSERNKALDRAAQNARLARVDALTGLYNRYALEHDLTRLPAEGSLTFIDLDGLKRYNDEYGHAHGDKLLCSFARALSTALDARGELYRVSGDEFALVCPSGDTAFIGASLNQALEAMKAGGFAFAGASHGSAHRRETPSLEQLKQLADRRMYEDKHRRKSDGRTSLETIVSPQLRP
jgi:diguanylate cyclase